ADDGTDLAARLAPEIGEARYAQAFADLPELRQEMVEQAVEIARQAGDEAYDLVLQRRQDQQDRQHQDQDEADADDGRRPDPRAAEPLQPVADGVEEIGDGHAGDEGQQHGAQQIEDDQESQERQQPEADLPRAVHHGASIWAIRQPQRAT